MSKHETSMTHRYWKKLGGTLLEEYPIVSSGPGNGWRVVDAIILVDGDRRIVSKAEKKNVSLNDRDIVVVQAKARPRRLGMSVLGQALFSSELIKQHFAPRSVCTVALCATDDAVLHLLAERFGIKVVVDDARASGPSHRDVHVTSHPAI